MRLVQTELAVQVVLVKLTLQVEAVVVAAADKPMESEALAVTAVQEQEQELLEQTELAQAQDRVVQQDQREAFQYLEQQQVVQVAVAVQELLAHQD